MNIKRDLVNRALAKAGQNPLTDADIENGHVDTMEGWAALRG